MEMRSEAAKHVQWSLLCTLTSDVFRGYKPTGGPGPGFTYSVTTEPVRLLFCIKPYYWLKRILF